MRTVRLRTLTIPIIAMLLCLAGARRASAQVTAGTISGTVVDNSGGVLPGATVTVTAANTGAVRTATTNEAGLFTVTGLNPGIYTIKIEMPSFSPLTVTLPNALAGGDVRDLGKLTMKVGGVQQTVEVNAAVTPVQVASSSRVKSVTSDDMMNIAMKGRDIYGMLAILPGVQDTNLNRDFLTWSSATSVTINGMNSFTKDVRVDGINAVDEGGCGTVFVNLNMDAVGEIQVISNGFTAENGRNTGGMVSITTKSGTNQFKGSAWYNGRRDRFNSNDYFRIQNNTKKPLYKVNIEGYSFGGPVVIPGVMDARKNEKKLYFFVSQEFTSDARPTTTTVANMPTALERAGDFSQTFQTNGSLQTLVNPLGTSDFFCSPGTGGLSGAACVPTTASTNIINPKYITPLGQKMLNLQPMPNGILNLQSGQQYRQNSQYDLTPEHSRTNNVLRLDQTVTDKTRVSFRFLKDRDDVWSYNNFTPGTGHVVNNTPGLVVSSTVTQVLRPTVVNEMTFGYAFNRWGFTASPDTSTEQGTFDYTSLYASTLGINAPRLRPFGAYSNPPKLAPFGGPQVDEWPYAPIYQTSGGSRTNLAGYMTACNCPLPRLNISSRGSFQDDLSITRGRHNFKFGVYVELDHKTEPGSASYMGSYSFSSDSNNPFNTNNGYANLLIGYFSSYSELTARVDKAVRHWQTEGYAQDNWRVTPRWTIDYGVRLTHAGAEYEVNNNHTGFYPDQWKPALADRLYAQACKTPGVQGFQTCSGSNQVAVDPLNPTVFLSSALVGNIVQGTGTSVPTKVGICAGCNGISTEGFPDEKPGTYATFPQLRAAPRVGFAWNMTGDGRTALRASTGIFYNFPSSSGGANGFSYSYAGGCPVSCNKQIRWTNFDAIAAAAAGGANFVESPNNVNVGGLRNIPLGKAYNANVTFQRDLGFNTVAEVAWVGNYAWNPGRGVDQNALPLFVYANPAALFNATTANANVLRQVYGQYPGMGAVTQFIPNLYNYILDYNSLQINVTRRLSHGLQIGGAYTLAKGFGYTGYDQYTDANPQAFGYTSSEAIEKAYYWAATPEDRRHNIVVNYSYNIPTFTNMPVVKQIVSDWQISGVTKLLSGAGRTPSCSANSGGLANSVPTLTNGLSANCVLTGQPINLNLSQSSDPLAVHFNTDAFNYPVPTGINPATGLPTIGNIGSPGTVRLLRDPTWHEWDVTLARRFPISVGGRKNSGVKLQLQIFNLFNEVQFTTLNASMTYLVPGVAANSAVKPGDPGSNLVAGSTGNFTGNTGSSNLGSGTIPPRVIGLTARFDW